MKVSLYTDPISKLSTQAIIIPVPEGADGSLPKSLAKLIPEAAHQTFKGKLDEVAVIYPAQGSIDRIVLTGLGDGKGTRSATELFRRAIATGVKQLVSNEIKTISIYLGSLFQEQYIYEAVLITLIAPYKFTKHQSKKEDNDRFFESLTLVGSSKKATAAHMEAMNHAAMVASAVNLARDLVNSPSNHMTPTLLANHAKEVARVSPQLTCKVLGKKELEHDNFGGLLAVSRGSDEEPKLIELVYRPKNKSSKVKGQRSKVPTVALVGKGVTFDTGGINLKPSQHIGDMHMDMAGGAAVIATMQAVAELALPINVVGIVPATENMPSGTAQKPGDVITSRSGKTIEVVDTDAEGRIILADAIDYAKSFAPDIILDAATLTGTALVALAEERAPIIGNDQELIEQLHADGESAGEYTWQLPLDDEYRAHVKSDVADVKNLGKPKRFAGTIAGAALLEKFVPSDTPWVHIDIAGTAMRSEPGPYWPKQGTGWGVRLFLEFLKSLV